MSEDIKRKLCSRKLWLAIAGFVCAVGALFGLSESVAAQITSMISAAGVVISYILGESIIDASKQ
jgi:hypothetical protein